MKFFTLFNGDAIHLTSDKKVLPAEEFSELISANEIFEKAREDAKEYKILVAKECEKLKEENKTRGFEEGLQKWNEQLSFLEKEITNVRGEMENTILPLALAAVKKIIGKELETKPQTIVNIISTALKSVSQHRKITIYVCKTDLDLIEENRTAIKKNFEHLESLSIIARNDIQEGGCIIETEAGIINAQLDNQLEALEVAFRTLFKNKKKKGT